MSILNDDKKVISEGRKKPLKDVKASKRDQVIAQLAKKLRADNIGEKIRNLWSGGNANRQEWLERQSEYLASWDEFLDNDASGPFAYSSNLHMPTIFTVVKTMHARFLQAIWGIDPPFNIKPRKESYVDRVPMITDTVRYAIKCWANKYSGIEEAVDKWIWQWISAGSSTLKWGWDVEYTRYMDVVSEEEDDVPEFKVDPATGKETLVPKTRLVEKEKEVTKKVFDGPTCTFVRVEDLLIIGGDGDPDKADIVMQQSYLDSSQLWTLADRGVFDEDAVSNVIQGGPSNEGIEDTSGMKQQRSEDAGQAETDHNRDHDRYQILEAYLRYDVDGSGIFSDIVVWVHPRSGELLRATYLRRINKAGEKPFKKIDFYIRDGQEYGAGVVEVLYPLAKEMDAMHNMRIDFGMLSTMPFGFYRPSSSINPETIQLEPGALIPVDNPQTDVFFPNLGNRTSFGFQEEAALQQMIDRVTSISELNLGVVGGQGATRTATGTKALLGESSANLDVHLRRLNRGWRRSIEYLLHMLQQRIPPGLSFRLTGDAGDDYWRQVRSREELAGDYDIEVSENSSNSNKQIQQDIAQQILQLTSNPLDIQLQLVNSGNRYAALKNYLQALGIKDWGRYVSKPQGYVVPLTPVEEADRILAGIPVPVSPDMDHDGFINFWKMTEENDELLGYYSNQQAIALAAQAQKHEQMKQALAMAQAQAANSAQQQANAAQSMNQPSGGGQVAAAQGQDAQTQPGPA